MRHFACCFGCFAVAVALTVAHPAPAAPADSKDSKTPAEPAKPAPAKPQIHTVKKGPFKIEVALDAVFEAQKMTEVVLRPEAWAAFKVLKAVEHGTQVKQGDLLVALELEKIDQAIADLRAEQQMADVSLKLAEQQLATLEKTTPMDLAAAQRTHGYVKEDTGYYFKVSRPRAIKVAHRSLESSQFQLEYAQEELDQLEKMYKADDLTEETEEIILKRARRALDSAKFYLDMEKIDHQRTLKVTIPRRDLSTKESAVRADLQFNTARVTLLLTLQKQRLEAAKLKLDRARAEEKLNKLLADRAAMTVKAPVSGVAYYGRCVRGKFTSGGSSSSGTLRRGGAIPANEVFMTVVQPRPMFIRATVPEKELQHLRAGIKGTAVPTGYPDLKLTAIVDRVAGVPISSGNFDARITVALDAGAEALMPGMTCKVKLVPYLNKDAIAVPAAAVSTDEVDAQKHYVYVLDKDGKPQKKCVKVGKRTQEQVEILEGLSEGDKVSLEKPKAEK